LSASESDVVELLHQTRQRLRTELEATQNLSLLRHSINDDLSYLKDDLVSSNYDEVREPSLLEDLETLQRSLKELTSVKQYIQVIEHGLQLGCALSVSLAGIFKIHRNIQRTGPGYSPEICISVCGVLEEL
jgi:hypothetical protein